MTPDDNEDFLKILANTVEHCNWRCHSYCLMNTHFHLLLEIPEGNLSEGMQFLNGIYSGGFNRRNNNVGHVMQGRYKSPLIKNEEYYLIVLRYIALNSVKAKIVPDPAEWKWSSYRALAGLSPLPDFLTASFSHDLFSYNPKNAEVEYKRFVDEGIEKARTGDLGFRPSLDDLLKRASENEQSGAMVEANQDYGYSMTEIAGHLGINCSTVSRAIKHFRATHEK